ncbi:MAG: extracellular solute-binding protein [Fimbriimonadales bacterium]|nr:extracellular solute-binding protein [Fimbriimonadales bacterium]
MSRFPYGVSAGVMAGLAVASGVYLATRRGQKQTADLRLWTFAKPHADAYVKMLSDFLRRHPGKTVDIQIVAGEAVTSRLQAAFWSNLDVPDLVEVEISWAGSFFRGKLESIGFRDLTERIHKTGLWNRIVQARFAPYTTRGRIFGIPHDVHPVMLAYRRDLVEKLGIDVDAIRTWDEFVEIGRRVTVPGKRFMMELPPAGVSSFEVMLFQRDGGYFDPQGNCTLDNEIAIETMKYYVPLVAGRYRIGNDLGGGQIFTRALEDGYYLFMVAPDWRTKVIEQDVPKVGGRMALMPLPAFYPGGRRTSTWGGTMIGITKRCADPDLAWELIMHLYLNKEALAEQFRNTNILPPARDLWDHPAYDEPRPFWSNQPLGRLYANLAPQTPPQYTSPYIGLAKAKLSEALIACVDYYDRYGARGFDGFVRQQMERAASEVRRQMRRNPYLHENA